MRARSICIALLILPALPGTAEGADAAAPPIVAVLDSGLRADHQEFAAGQVVAWWDFTADAAARHRPLPGETWDLLVPGPYDPRGHGTATASLAAGLDANAAKHASGCQGCRLAIGKVVESTGRVDLAALRDAIHWAADDVRADVISISLGLTYQGTGVVPGVVTDLDEALRHARAAGALVVVAGGNGLQGGRLPGQATWTAGLGFSEHALVVGGAGRDAGTLDGATFSHDPEVVARAVDVTTAYATGPAAYVTWSGSSLSTATVAGYAARVKAAALREGCGASPDDVEALLKRGARDTASPHAWEGWGFLGAAEVAAIEARLADGCARPAGAAASAVYEPLVADRGRFLVSEGADAEGPLGWLVAGAAPPNGARVIGPATSAAFEVEVWRVVLAEGQTLDARLRPSGLASPADGADNLQLVLLDAAALDDGLVEPREWLASSLRPTRAEDALVHREARGRDALVVVAGALVATAQPYELVLRVDGQEAAAAWAGASLAAGYVTAV